MKVLFQINDQIISQNLNGETHFGNSEVLLSKDTNLLEGLSWEKSGHCVQPFIDDKYYKKLHLGLTNKVKNLIEISGGSIDEKFNLENYHHYVTDEIHLKIAKELKNGWNIESFPIDINKINTRLSQILKRAVTAEGKHMGIYNYYLRIVRPMKFQDNNPPHRDVWLDILRNAANIYVPLSGNSPLSSLPLIPGSHFAKESTIERTKKGALLNGTRYSVPCVISYNRKHPKLIRPLVEQNEVMVFSPYLIHGGGYNFQENKTRVSLEMRFWKK